MWSTPINAAQSISRRIHGLVLRSSLVSANFLSPPSPTLTNITRKVFGRDTFQRQCKIATICGHFYLRIRYTRGCSKYLSTSAEFKPQCLSLLNTDISNSQ